MLSLGLGAGVLAASAEPILIGLYPPGPLLSPPVMDTITDVDNWIASTGKRVSIAATAVTLEEAPYFLEELEGAWSRGYVPFVNFRSSSHTTTQIANGLADAPIRAWAVQFALWAKNGQRRAFIAPLLEMNGYWNPFYVPAGYAQFKGAYQRILQIFQEELTNQGVVHHAISRVWAPNGWPPPPSPDAFENYFPGLDLVDVVSVNGYNFGGCTNPASWDNFDTALKVHLDRLPAIAPGKPIFISETGTVKEGGDKNQWLQELFTRVTAIPNFRAVLYLNKGEIRNTLPNCPNGTDYRLHEPGTDLWLGFKNTIGALSNYVYWAPNSPEMRQFFGDAPKPIRPVDRDFNGDGKSDILWLNSFSGNVALWFMNANGTIQSSAGLGNLAGWTPTVGDFNGDGIADILWQNTSSGNAGLWFMNANGTVQSSAGLGNLAGWTPTVGDFNGDGIADILWQNTSSGNAGLWFMNANGTVQSSAGLGNLAGWTPTVGDFNGDGIADILWQSNASGNVGVWFMKANGTVQSSAGLGSVPGWITQ
jgi:hypothetical protein